MDLSSDTRLDASSGIEREVCLSLWGCVSGHLSGRIGAATFDRWFRNVALDRIDEEAAVLVAPSSIYQVWIEENFLRDVQASLEHFLKNCPPIIFELGPVAPANADGGDSAQLRDHGTDETDLLELEFEKQQICAISARGS